MENTPPSAITGPVTDAERTYAIEVLKKTQADLHQSLSDLSDSQLLFKPAADRWSIYECTEHIALVERGILKAIQKGMEASADPNKRTEIKVSDVDVIKAVRSRTATLPAPAPFVPTGRYGDTTTALQQFDEQREAAIDYAQTVSGDLRTHFFPHPYFGTLDAYQAMLVMGSHAERHRKQIEEVKASADFPQ